MDTLLSCTCAILQNSSSAALVEMEKVWKADLEYYDENNKEWKWYSIFQQDIPVLLTGDDPSRANLQEANDRALNAVVPHMKDEIQSYFQILRRTAVDE